MRETVTALLEGVGIVWLMIFSTSLTGLETVLDLPTTTAEVKLGAWSYLLAALIIRWLVWMVPAKLLHPATAILKRKDLGAHRLRLIRSALIRAARPPAVIAFVLFVACHASHATLQVGAVLGVLVAMRWFARSRPRVAQRLIDGIMPADGPADRDRPAAAQSA